MRTHCKWGHPLTAGNAYLWRGSRYCKVCRRVREKLRKRGSKQAFAAHLSELIERGTLFEPQRGPLGACKQRLEAEQTPTVCDMAWAAGIFEGEGTCADRHRVSV